MAKPLAATSVFFPADPKRLRSQSSPGRETAMRAVFTGQRMYKAAASALAWRTFRRVGGDRPGVPVTAIALLAVDLVTGIRQQLIDLDDVLNILRGRAVDEEWTLSEQDLRRVALQLATHPDQAPDLRVEPGVVLTGARIVARSFIGCRALPERALEAAQVVELDGVTTGPSVR
jgi:hypothetical protein